MGIEWQPSNSASFYPKIVLNFGKLGLNIFTLSSAAMVTPEYPSRSGYKYQEKFPEFLEKLVNDKDSEHQSAVDLRNSKGWAFPIESIYLSNLADPVTDRAHIEKLLAFAGLPLESSYRLSLSLLLGTILSRAFLFSTGGTIFHRKSTLIENAQNGSRTLDQEIRDSMEHPTALESDGWNLAEYLFNLKNSADSYERSRFRVIQEAFNKLFPNLTFDAIYRSIKLRNNPGTNHDYRYPTIVVCDDRNSKQFSLDKIGAGISETMFLLTAFFGSSDSVVLLDEPAVNLHPAQMKALLSNAKQSTKPVLSYNSLASSAP